MHNYKQNEKVMKNTIYRYMSPTDKNRHICLNIYKKSNLNKTNMNFQAN